MDKGEYQWLVELVQDRYEYLSLTFEQAEHVYRYEQIIAEPAGTEFLTRWEELDFELATMRQILSAEQFTLFLVSHSEALDFHIEQLRKTDNDEKGKLAYYQDELRYYQETAVPRLLKEIKILPAIVLDSGRHRLQFVQEQYNWHLRKQWKSIVAQHYREYRSFGPHAFELLRVQHELSVVWPDYGSFMIEVDKPARALIKAVLKDTDYVFEMYEAALKEQEQDIAAFHRKLWKQHFGPYPPRGYVFNIEVADTKYRIQWLFRLLCLSHRVPDTLTNLTTDREPTGHED